MTSVNLLILVASAALYNVVVFGVYAFDKAAARNGDWRVRESTLLWLAVLGGGIGAFLGQRLLRHKTRKPPFHVVLPALFVLQTFLGLAVLLAPQAALAAIRAGVQALAGS
ncbi:DUF1294 domain-containing protein [Rhizobium sp. KAs_5_22]|uniref:DUF1294 domain-containing protein n=1 Tax=Ciceribacter selenitireducens TaxID=448181 RepID=UPI00048F7F36|nr:DUF1294 domain-containing protein [Ciceribacter selenitireducens]PPJ48658.1 DUF1294 domain-containing protein [Rhizobium sp. KAs_5_22]